MWPKSLILTPGLVISIHPLFPPHTHDLSLRVRGLFACPVAPTISTLSIWDSGKREPHTGRTKNSPGSLRLALGENGDQGDAGP